MSSSNNSASSTGKYQVTTISGPANIKISKPWGLAVASDSSRLFFADEGSHCINFINLRVDDLANASISLLAGTPYDSGHVNGRGSVAKFHSPRGLALHGSVLYVADYENNAVRKITDTTSYGLVHDFVDVALPVGLAVDSLSGTDLFISGETGEIYRYNMVSKELLVLFDGFDYLGGLAFDPISERLFIAAPNVGCVQALYPYSLIRHEPVTIAGVSGTCGFSDGSASSEARFGLPTGVAVDRTGQVFIVDSFCHAIRRLSEGHVRTIAGGVGGSGYAGGDLKSAKFSHPLEVAVDFNNSRLFVTDSGNKRIRVFPFLISSYSKLTAIRKREGLESFKHISTAEADEGKEISTLVVSLGLDQGQEPKKWQPQDLEFLRQNRPPGLTKAVLRGEWDEMGKFLRPALARRFWKPNSLTGRQTPGYLDLSQVSSPWNPMNELEISVSEITSETMEEMTHRKQVFGKAAAIKSLTLWSASLQLPQLSTYFKTTELGKISRVDLANGQLQTLDALPALRFLTELDASHNELKRLPGDLASRWPELRILHLHSNHLKAIAAVKPLKHLQYLDVSNNQVTDCPFQFSSAEIEDFHIENNPLIAPYNMLLGMQETGQRVAFLRDIGVKTAPWRQIKVVLCGKEGVGKTHLMHRLQNRDYPINKSTNGIEIHLLQDPVVNLCVYDMGGQAVFYPTHQFFLSPETIYLIVFNAAKPDFPNIELWVQTILALGPSRGVQLLFVGTHIDQLKSLETGTSLIRKELELRLKKLISPLPLHCEFIDSTAYFTANTGVPKVREQLLGMARKSKHHNAMLPEFYQIAYDKVVSRSKMHPFETLEEFEARSPGVEIDSLLAMISVFNQTGVVTWFDDSDLRGVVVLDPQWLANLMASFISFTTNWSSGRLTKANMDVIWKDTTKYPLEMRGTLVRLLERFEVIFPTKHDEEWIVPCMMAPDEPPEFSKNSTRFRSIVVKTGFFKIIRQIRFGFVPKGFFSRLIVRLAHLPGVELETAFVSGAILRAKSDVDAGTTTTSPESHQPEAWLKEQILVEFIESQEVGVKMVLKITALVPLFKWEATILASVMHAVQSLVRASLKAVASLPKAKPKILTSCSHCLSVNDDFIKNPCFLDLDPITSAFANGHKEGLTCPRTFVALPLSRVAPDICLSHLKNLTGQVKDIGRLLGMGGSGRVQKGQLGSKAVAVKTLESNSSHFEDWYAEAFLMSSLNHKNLVQFEGIMLSPTRIVMEFCNLGDLDRLARNHYVPDTLKVKLLLDIAKGMEYLHSKKPPIIHRDLRTVNIFVAGSLDNGDLTAKVGDFGLSQTSYHLSDSLATWEWVAPETLSEAKNLSTQHSLYFYNELSDVYSFAMVCWQLFHPHSPLYGEYFSAKSPFKGDTKLIREAIVTKDLRPTFKVNAKIEPQVVEIAKLARKCWRTNPTHRPNFAQIASRLQAQFDKIRASSTFIHTSVKPIEDVQAAITASEGEEVRSEWIKLPRAEFQEFVAELGPELKAKMEAILEKAQAKND